MYCKTSISVTYWLHDNIIFLLNMGCPLQSLCFINPKQTPFLFSCPRLCRGSGRRRNYWGRVRLLHLLRIGLYTFYIGILVKVRRARWLLAISFKGRISDSPVSELRTTTFLVKPASLKTSLMASL